MKLFLSHRRTSLVLKAILIVGVAGALWEQQWLTAAVTIGILLITFTPLLLAQRFRVVIPSEFELLAIAFVFTSLFLGEVRGFYTRFWWWDIVLHTASGFLLGIVGFLLVHVLNEIEEVGLHMKAGFVAFFAFLFALGMGTLWEIFEFSMDSLFGLNMQKPMFGDASGLTDTMWDLIVDAVGALTIAVLGYIYLKTARRRSFLQRWILAFIRHNPRLFRRQAHPRTRRN
ncbi:hypothetical protein TspCOW1_28290 [Thiohalobacter sp. COW1]|uniref:hypothetical protein n=1 Tax=Thiohalobacter sp. COW1 TaxID=2795687 RepID=UPI001915B4CF|nr:hypothetical protein [Thiohalobacter sp. COW1]BCO32726.1 hypothetical protein TspCOW1_28290 [Thiohalobacter sp. COW1]